MSLISNRFLKEHRIRKSKDYKYLSQSGQRYKNKCFVFVYRLTGDSFTRLGITASKKTGNAVTRNRIKRIIREYFRTNRDQLEPGIALNVIVRSISGKMSADALRDQLKNGFDSVSREVDKQVDAKTRLTAD